MVLPDYSFILLNN